MMDEPTPSQPSRIAIKFGGSSVSTPKPTHGARKTGQFQPPSALGKRSRPHALGGHSDSEEDEAHGRHEVVTSFGAKGAVNEARGQTANGSRNDAKPIVIACQANRDWKSEAQAQQNRKNITTRQHEKDPKAQRSETEPADQDKDVKWGLSVTKKAAGPGTSEIAEDQREGKSGAVLGTNLVDNNQEGVADDRRNLDQDALSSLLGHEPSRKKRLIISDSVPLSETEALQRDYQAVGEVSTVEEYGQIPDGEFGLAMLRGMGFDERVQRPKAKEVKRRSHLLGLGAKEDEEIKKAELAKKYGHRERRPRLGEYLRDKEKERRQREERYSGSYKNERTRERDRERERPSQSQSRKYDSRDQDRNRYRDRPRDGYEKSYRR